MSPSLPGSAGLPIVGDRSLEFYADPVKFVDVRITRYKSRIFLTRLLSKPTVIIASHAALKQALNDEALHMGYKAFMGEIYGDNVLFAEGRDAIALRDSLMRLFTPFKVERMRSVIERCIQHYIPHIFSSDEVDGVYEKFKVLTTSLCLSLFLEVDEKTANSLTEDIRELTIAHWHGIISVPVAVKVPLLKGNAYSRALQAKEKLLSIIRQKLELSPQSSDCLSNCILTELGDSAANHLLLFTSALVPKALASILASFCFQTSHMPDLIKKMREDNSLVLNVLRETMRLHPPFFGGRRLADQATVIDGYKIAKGHSVVYSTYWAHRDERVFTNPDSFNPDRWISGQLISDDLLSLGFGLRGCVGKHLVNEILQYTAKVLLNSYTWTLPNDHEPITYKWLPVTRPVNKVNIVCHCVRCLRISQQCTCADSREQCTCTDIASQCICMNSTGQS